MIGSWLAYSSVTGVGVFIGLIVVGGGLPALRCSPIFKKGGQALPSPKLSEGMLQLMNDGWEPASRCRLFGFDFDLSSLQGFFVFAAIIVFFASAGLLIARRLLGRSRSD